jgi:serine protease Do
MFFDIQSYLTSRRFDEMKIDRKIMTLLAVVAFVAAAPLAVLAQSSATAGTSSLQTLQLSLREVSAKVLPSVVEVNVKEAASQPRVQSPFGQTPRGGQGPVSALGSGIIVRHTGNKYYVLTNNHVIDNATDISVRLGNQKEFKATVVGKDSLKDLAMVSFTSNDDIPVAVLGDSDTLQVRDIVLAVGNPLGFESTVTMGIVSALGRRGPTASQVYTSYIQTDAAINEGNSGGALVNIAGQVVGINTWIAAPSGGNIGLGFAIPVNSARSDVEDFITKGSVQYGWLGVSITDVQDASVYPNYAKDMKLEGVNGAMVMEVYKGSPAFNAGLLPGDYVTRVDTTDIKSSDQLTQVVGGLVAGKTYQFSLIRAGQKMTIAVKIGVRNQDALASQLSNLWPGMTVLDITDAIRQQAQIPQGVQGVVVVDISDQSVPAAAAGIQTGDVIRSIDGKAIGNVQDYFKALNDTSRKSLAITVVREGTDVKITLNR